MTTRELISTALATVYPFRRAKSGWVGGLLAILLSSAVEIGSVQAQVRRDEVVLHSGQRLFGSVEENRVGAQNAAELVVALEDGTTLILQREVFRSWKPEPPAMAEYRERVSQVAATAESQWELAAWCDENKLKEQADTHARLTLEQDPEHERARRLLRHVRIQGKWVDFEQVRARWGYVKVASRWVLPEVAELSKALKEQQELANTWKSDLTTWFRIVNRSPRNAPENLAKIRNVRDPAAVGTLAEMLMTRQPVEERREIISVLSQIPTLASTNALLEYYLHNQDPNDVEGRERCLQAIAKRDEHKPQVARRLVDQLHPDLLGDRSKLTDLSIPPRNTDRLTRAATALRVLEVPVGIEQLIVAMRVNYVLKSSVQQNAAIGSAGVQGGGGSREIERAIVHDCPAALETLRKFTGKNFPHDQQQWMRWWIAENTPKNLDLRRDF